MIWWAYVHCYCSRIPLPVVVDGGIVVELVVAALGVGAFAGITFVEMLLADELVNDLLEQARPLHVVRWKAGRLQGHRSYSRSWGAALLVLVVAWMIRAEW